MLSGVGDAAELQRHGIPVVHHLPEVGRNLADHLDITLMHAANSRLPVGLNAAFVAKLVAGLISYAVAHKGVLTSNIAEAGGFVKSSPERNRPNLQFHFLPSYIRDHGRELSFGYGYTLHVCDLLPKSRGHVGLKSPHPWDNPLIDPNYLGDSEDMETMLAAFRIARRILEAPALKSHSKGEVQPGPSVQSRDEIVAFIRQNAETIYHPVGTCRMGADDASVVDPELRVRGVEALRVIDASVMPSLVAGNTNAPTMMIAENAADMIAWANERNEKAA